jgi:hypothetical protein
VSEIVLVAVAVLADEASVCVGEEACYSAENGALATTGGTEDDGPVAGEIEVDVERERPECSAKLKAVMMP